MDNQIKLDDLREDSDFCIDFCQKGYVFYLRKPTEKPTGKPIRELPQHYGIIKQISDDCATVFVADHRNPKDPGKIINVCDIRGIDFLNPRYANLAVVEKYASNTQEPGKSSFEVRMVWGIA